ncbi:MAG TPA: type II CAAX endopeptidase family protein [Gemmatimonadaceae bacterium]|nr:type II CAAX endopeptidase family protein [Gemmatimonadaceae bacterium]
MSASPPSIGRSPGSITTPRTGSVRTFILLVFALSVPFWVVGAVTGRELMEGLPVAALMAFCPIVVAVILTYRERGAPGARELLQRPFDHERVGNPIWYVPILLLMPGMMLLAYGLLRAMEWPLPAPRFSLPTAAALFVGFFVGAIGEEVGWSGYVTDRMLLRWNALQAAVLLGLVWGIWHAVPLVQAHRSPAWIAWHCLNAVGTRVIMVWLYDNTGRSVFGAVLYHAMVNVSYFMFPDLGALYVSPLTASVVPAVALILAVVWGPRTLARFGRA